MMDTQVLPQNITIETTQEDPKVLPRELEAAIAKHDKTQLRVEMREGWGSTTGGLALSQRYIGTLSLAVAAVLGNPSHGSSVDRPLLRVLSGLDPDVIALCIIQTSLHAMAQRQDMRGVFLAVGHNLAGECWGAALTQHNPRMAASIAKAVKSKHGSTAHRQKAARTMASKAKQNAFTERDWPKDLKLRAGAWGVDLMMTTLAGAFNWREENGAQYLDLTEGSWGIVDAALNEAVTRNPVFFPSTTAPKLWDAWSGCGPTDPRVNGVVTFLRSNFKETAAAVRGAIRTGEAQPALDAVNNLQNVRWTVNTALLDIISTCWERNVPVKGLPQQKDLPIPGKLPDDVWKAMTDGERRFSRMRNGELHQLNRAAVCDRIMFHEDMRIAHEMAVQEHFFTPMNCDWRGRVYGLTHFNFQREDRVRALFLFADGEPIGEDGLKWLKVHVANCGDFGKISKRPFPERVQWADDNMADITAYGLDPFAATGWMQADKPFLFLAACLELIAAIEHGPSYVARVPVSFDGSCSGLQHLSAMTRASEGALVNLTPSELPQDVYETVAALVRQRVTLDLDHEPEDPEDEKQVKASDRTRALARLFLDFGITRKECKRCVMTYAYSSKKFGMAQQVQVDLMMPLAREVLEGRREEHPFDPYQDGSKELPSVAARYLAHHTFDAIETVVSKPGEAMKFLQKLARALAHEGKPLRWTSPVGIPWINRYHDPKTKRVELFLHEGGVRVRKQITVAVGDESTINKDKASNGVAPNFVHALDAAHLLLVANAAAREGIPQIATVHDSFGCLPSHATRFNQIIREEFLRMYETHDVLDEVLQQATCDITQNNRERLPDAVEYGPLNLKEILNADFAFA